MRILTILLLNLFTHLTHACDVDGIDGKQQWDRNSSMIIQKLISSNSRDCHEQWVGLIHHKDQNVRTMVASTVGEQKILPELSIPALVANFFQANGEEGAIYYEAVAKFGKQAENDVMHALKSESWLVRTRACDALMIIRKAKDRNQRQWICLNLFL